MGAEHPPKRSYAQTGADIAPDKPPRRGSGKFSDQAKGEVEVDGSLQQPVTDAESTVDGLSQRGCRELKGVKTDAGGCSKRPCLNERWSLDVRDFDHTQRKVPPHKRTHTSGIRELSARNNSGSPSTCNAIDPSSCIIDPKDSLADWPENKPSRTLPLSPPPSRPSFTQLATDGQQGMKVLFLIDHATKGDAIHHNISAYIHRHSSEMKLLMRKYQKDRSHLQSRFFGKARIICAQLTSGYQFWELEREESNKVDDSSTLARNAQRRTWVLCTATSPQRSIFRMYLRPERQMRRPSRI